MKIYQVDFERGDILYHEGDEPKTIFLIEDGEIEIFRQRGDRRISVQVLVRGQFSGETGVLEGKRHPMSARAQTDFSCLAIPRDEFEAELDLVSPIVRRILRNLVVKLRHATNRTYGQSNR